jgi:hypothetical protein
LLIAKRGLSEDHVDCPNRLIVGGGQQEQNNYTPPEGNFLVTQVTLTPSTSCGLGFPFFTILEARATLIVLCAGGRKSPKLEVPFVQDAIPINRNLIAWARA